MRRGRRMDVAGMVMAVGVIVTVVAHEHML
jgi:hypothetical protein